MSGVRQLSAVRMPRGAAPCRGGVCAEVYVLDPCLNTAACHKQGCYSEQEQTQHINTMSGPDLALYCAGVPVELTGLQEKGRRTWLHAGGAAAVVSCAAWLWAYIYGRMIRRRVRPAFDYLNSSTLILGSSWRTACLLRPASSSWQEPTCAGAKMVAGVVTDAYCRTRR